MVWRDNAATMLSFLNTPPNTAVLSSSYAILIEPIPKAKLSASMGIKAGYGDGQCGSNALASGSC